MADENELLAQASDLISAIANDIITELSRIRLFFVIARTSSFAYKKQDIDVKQVARELGVRHLVEGSVRRSGERIRITAQLIDAETGNHMWAERYDCEIRGPESFDRYTQQRLPWFQPDDFEHMLDGLRKAGWQE